MNRIVILLLSFGVFMLSACEKEIELDLPEEERLVLLSNFSPDSLFRVSLATSLPINGTANQMPDYPANANIQLFENGNYVDDLSYRPEGDLTLPAYVLNQKPVEGAVYSIVATVPNYPTVSASNKIPEPVAIEGLEDVFIFEYPDTTGISFYDLDACLKIGQQVDTTQYFHLLAYHIVNDRIWPVSIYNFDNVGTDIFHENGFLFNSNEFSNGSRRLNIGLSFICDLTTGTKSPVYIELRNVSPDYYRFHESVGEQELSSGNNQSVLSTEAYFIYNNIAGGIGNFSGYSAVIDSLEY